MSKLHSAPPSARSIGFRRSSNPRPILSSSRSSVKSPSRLTFSARRSAGATWFSASPGNTRPPTAATAPGYGYREDGLVSYILALSETARYSVYLQVNARDTDELDVQRVIDSL